MAVRQRGRIERGLGPASAGPLYGEFPDVGWPHEQAGRSGGHPTDGSTRDLSTALHRPVNAAACLWGHLLAHFKSAANVNFLKSMRWSKKEIVVLLQVHGCHDQVIRNILCRTPRLGVKVKRIWSCRGLEIRQKYPISVCDPRRIDTGCERHACSAGVRTEDAPPADKTRRKVLIALAAR
jgi:hypothetical protein